MASCDRPDQPAVVTYWMNRLQGHRVRQELPRHPQRPRADRPGPRRSRSCTTSTRSTPPRRSRAQARLGAPRHRPDRVRRRLPRLGLPRGRLPLRRRGGAALRGRLVSAPARSPTHRRSLPPLPALGRGSGHAPAVRPRPPRLPARRLPVAGRPRRAPAPAAGTCGRSPASAARTTSATRRCRSRRNVERFLALRGIGLGDGAGSLMLANARVLGHVFDPLSRLLVLRHRRRPRLRRRGGAQHLRRAPRLPAASRPRRDRRARTRSSTSRRSSTSAAPTQLRFAPAARTSWPRP